MSNTQRFDNSVYTSETVINEAVIFNQHIDKSQPNWMVTSYDSWLIVDEISYLDIGQHTPREMWQYTTHKLGLSYSDNWNSYYKIAGFTVYRNLDNTIITRSVYDSLNFLGDVGGLEAILGLIGWVIVN
jgi:hypothetical protein